MTVTLNSNGSWYANNIGQKTVGFTVVGVGADPWNTNQKYRGVYRFPLTGLDPTQPVQTVVLDVGRQHLFQQVVTEYIGHYHGPGDPGTDSATDLYNGCQQMHLDGATVVEESTSFSKATYNDTSSPAISPVTIDLGPAAAASLAAALQSGASFWAIAIQRENDAGSIVDYNNTTGNVPPHLTVTQSTGPNPPTPLAPLKSAVAPFDHVTIQAHPAFEFQYSHPQHTAGTDYQWQLDVEGGDFSSPFFDTGIVTVGIPDGTIVPYYYNLGIADPALVAGTVYQWRVRARANAIWSAWSDTSFARVVLNPGPDTPAYGTPTAGDAVASDTPTLQWGYAHALGLLQRSAYIDIETLSPVDGTVILQEYLALVYDDFNRANGAIGNALTGQAWQVVDDGTHVAIVSNRAQVAGDATAPLSERFAYIDCGTSDVRVIALAYANPPSTTRIVFRYKDINNYWYIDVFSSGVSAIGQSFIKVGRKTAGVDIVLRAYPATPDPTTGYVQDIAVEVLAQGNNIAVTLNEKVLYSVTDTTFNDQTKVGFGSPVSTGMSAYMDEFMCLRADGVGEATLQFISPSLTIGAGNTYKFRAKNYDGRKWGPLSSFNNFRPVQAPSGTITSPTEGGQVSGASPTVTWTYSGNTALAKWRLQLYQSSALIWDSNIVYSNDSSAVVPTRFLKNNTAYQFQLTVWDSDGLSSVSTRNFSVVFTPPPILTGSLAVAQTGTFAYGLSWNGSALADIDFQAYWVYRMLLAEGVWERIAIVPIKAQHGFTDYFCPLNSDVQYAVTQVQNFSGDALESAKLISATKQIVTTKIVLSDVTNPNIFTVLEYNPNKGYQRQRDFRDVSYWGREKPVRHYGTAKYAKGTLGAMIAEDTLAFSQAVLAGLEAVASNENIVCVRDTRGRKWFVYLDPIQVADELPNQFNVTLSWTEADYTA